MKHLFSSFRFLKVLALAAVALTVGYSAQAQSNTVQYKLGAGDEVRITVFGEPDMSGQFKIDGGGNIGLPLVGNIQGGGRINGAFLKHKLIDEFSTLIHPAVDGVAGTQTIVDYEGPEGDKPGAGQALRLISCETLEGGMVWLRHAVERN